MTSSDYQGLHKDRELQFYAFPNEFKSDSNHENKAEEISIEYHILLHIMLIFLPYGIGSYQVDTIFLSGLRK